MFKSAIVVLGGGLKENGDPNEWTKRRLDKSFELYHKQPQLILALSRGTPYKTPPLDKNGFPLDESYVGAQYLIAQGVESKDIRIEPVSLDTNGNAYFSRVLFVDPLSIQKLIIVTSNFHLERARHAFQWVYSLNPHHNYMLEFIGVSDDGIDSELMKERKIKEQNGILRLQKNKERINTWEKFHEYIYTEHTAYSALREREKISNTLSKSY